MTLRRSSASTLNASSLATLTDSSIAIFSSRHSFIFLSRRSKAPRAACPQALAFFFVGSPLEESMS